jgi:hyperosmotically inducible periplasmic protein
MNGAKSMKQIKLRGGAYVACAALIVVAANQSMAVNGPSSAASATSAASAAGASSRSEDRALRRQVYAAFAKDKRIDAGDIGVSAKDGAVTLTGTAADAAQIDKASVLAKGVPGVNSLTNKLTVRRNFGQ